MKVKQSFDPFHLYNNYYDLLYHDKDYLTEARYISAVIHEFIPQAKSIIELGSGTGNYSRVFCELGYAVTGIERSAQMISIADSKSIAGFHSVAADMADFEIDGVFDAAVALFHVLSYLTKNDQMLSCLRQVSRHLKPAGLFIFDVWYTPAVYTQLPETREKRVEDDEIAITRVASPRIDYQTNTVEISYKMMLEDKTDSQRQELQELHHMRHFSTPEIELLASLAGFTLLRSEEFLTAKKPGPDTWGVCYILQKND